MDLEIPHGADREYLIVFGVAAIYIATIPRGEPCIVGVSRQTTISQRGCTSTARLAQSMIATRYKKPWPIGT
ncbi:hypothetical protein GA0061099_101912 [Bradyrhizobium yuanmingense]|uniref:Uncharacterized protein n=1 Tax=Bradyrhizobium yuanmingense TaxID=108015 RepID=A0A1C3XH01_9BRAD|nr:hypothetical protein IQ15_07154 [Bradyrhizobium yuanmingense]SCB51533.1 hypothetical protein GA0061099_101912 [Bradyrhizobium yuanmingense]